jgi:hypothetical protein
MTFKQIERLPYGSPEQNKNADTWYEKFARFRENHPLLADGVWNRIHLTDVGSLARERWMYKD